MRSRRFADLPPPTWCVRCRKVIGPRGGYDGPECSCDQPVGSALRGAHSVGTYKH